MAEEIDVKTRLTLDSAAVALLDKIAGGFGKVDDARQDAQQGVGEFAKNFAAQFAAINLQPAISKVLEYGKSFFHVGVEAQGADQAITGMIMAVQGRNWEDAHGSAIRLRHELDDIAVGAGQANADVRTAFSSILEISGATSSGIEKAKKTTGDLTTIANVLGKSAQQYAQQYAFAAKGAIEVKSQLFQLLAPTGIFGDNMQKAAGYWTSITEESRIKLLEYGVGRVASQLGKAAPTMGDLLATMENVAEISKETFGAELIAQLQPEIQSFVDELREGRGELTDLAKNLGRDVGHYVREAAREVRKGYEYVKAHYAELRDFVVDAFNHAKSIVEWIIAHKEEIAIAFGAKATKPIVGQVAKGVGALTSTAAKGVSSLGIAGTGGGLLMGGAVVAAFAAAVAAWALAIDQWKQLMDITESGKGEKERDQGARQRYFEQMISAPSIGPETTESIKRFEEVKKAFVATAVELGEDSRAAGELADRAWAAHRAVRQQVEGVEKVADVFKRLEETGGVGGLDVSKPVAVIDEAFTGAMKAQNQGVQQYVADLLLKSKALQGSFLAASGLTSEGFETLAKLVEGKSKEFADKLREVAGIEAGKAAKPEAPKVVFNGATITVKQDFRNQDPDRVAIVFKRDMARAAERRYTAATGSPFGT